jgi:hypothetical protein
VRLGTPRELSRGGRKLSIHIVRSLPALEDFEIEGYDDLLLPVKGEPQRLDPGDTVFLAHRGRILFRAKLEKVRPVPHSDKIDYLEQGVPQQREIYHYLCLGRIKRIRGGPAFIGRVGIRYVDKLTNKSLRKRLMGLVL